MALQPGDRLGPYDVVGAIGAGGMGEVYRARDTKLDRDVALKVLPSHLASDGEALSRFEREAKAIAALSHPNILAIHDFGTHDGVAYAVTELLEGETLRHRLEGGPLPTRKVVEIGAAIAHGLAAAHDKGIVHRDLKPENVFVTSEGHVKILDFGLAKLVQEVSGPSTGPESPTALGPTDPGTVMGTVGYMAPEQVRGASADHRADIFSFGAVLYEMATGRRAFARDTAAETMTAILREDLPEPAEHDAPLLPALDQIVRHALEKQPAERFRSSWDLAFALEALARGSGPTGATAVIDGASRPGAGRGRLVAGAVVLAVVAFLAGWSLSRGAAGQAPAAVTFEQVTDAAGVESRPTLSPDGRTVVYSASSDGDWGLFSLRVGSRTPVPLTPDAPGVDTSPAFSPDGERIAFRSERDGGGIFLMTATGESITRLTDYGQDPAWSPDGRELVVALAGFGYPTDVGSRNTGLAIVDVETRERRDLALDVTALQPHWSRSGERIAYWALRSGGQRDLWTVAADGSEAEGVTVTDDAALDWSPIWSPDGRHLYFSSTRGGTMNLWRVPIDESTGATRGEPEPVTAPSLWTGALSFSADGQTLAFASVDWRSALKRVAFDPEGGMLAGAPELLRSSTRSIRDHALSPDGEWVAFTETSPNENLFVARTDGSEYRQLTNNVARDRAPVWSPDGSRIAFYSDRSGTSYDIWWIRPDGTGLEPLTDTPVSENFPTWSPDGRQLAVSSTDASWRFIAPDRLETSVADEAWEPAIDDLLFWPMSWSADGTRLAGLAAAPDGSAPGVYEYVRASGSYRRLASRSTSRWGVPMWLPDSRRLLVRNEEGIWLVDSVSGQIRRLISLGGYAVGRSLGLSSDGRWITYTETGSEGDIWVARFSDR